MSDLEHLIMLRFWCLVCQMPFQIIMLRFWCLVCQMPTPNTKNGALWDVPNLKKYATPLQYYLKYETVWTTITKINIIILLRFSLSSSINISLSIFSLCHSQNLSHFFSLCHSLSLPSPPCSRKLLKITL